MKNIHFCYRFHAVGQGLFASGHLHELAHEQHFHWVYDCGTSSRRAYLKREIALYQGHFKADPIPLFCLSHFDEDHINGACDLLSRHKVGTLVMPYFPLVDRIQIALSTPGLSNDYLSFLVDPVAYLSDAGGDGNPGQIIMIAGGTKPFPEKEEEGEPPPPSGSPDSDLSLGYPLDAERGDWAAEATTNGTSAQKQRPKVRVFQHHKRFPVGNVWEFFFYNEHIPDSKAAGLRQEVESIITKHRRADGSFEGTSLLRELKPLYVRTFGPSGFAQNRISLVTYSGPMHLKWGWSHGLCGGIEPVGLPDEPWHCHGGWGLHDPDRSKLSLVYFGDFPLTSPDRLNAVRNHFGRTRWDRLQVVQVPHHGSAHSWYNGASAEFQHQASVVSSARRSDHHPSQSVLDDLATHGVVLVNEMQRAYFCGDIHFT